VFVQVGGLVKLTNVPIPKGGAGERCAA
jgi:hypothetical protein